MNEFLEQIRRGAVTLTPELAAAFAAVPREVFVPDGFRRNDGGWARPGDDDFLALVYQDDALVTKVRGKMPVSSSSQPSLMALMIEALDVRPGMRVLEIGAGTGYNAAVLASIGATVTSVDVQEDVAERARAALARAGVEGVTVERGDGYAGHPGGRFDRVIVTVGVAGLSPRWLDQLEPDGVVIAPVDHAGMHPVLAARRPETLADPAGPLSATLVCDAGFMTAAGPLAAGHPGSFPSPAGARELAELTEVAPARFDPPLDAIPYRDLWYACGVWDRRTSHAAVPGIQQSCLALIDADRTGAAVIMPDGSVRTAGPTLLGAEAAAVLDRWIAAGRPGMSAWRVGFTLTGDPAAPIWVPSSWEPPFRG
ncbi:protein-L-isoaspartate O-methyltransferase [Actinoplanes sp. NPDC051343]|uniref:protein-L-isoaspartate O-methyltransferase n=1 Tax=Actinoplanes sp. NPDC051343 TaxID=3363906 RepID=UPI0037BBF551